MADRPILFSGDMVRAILAGTKTVTRRPVRSNVVETSEGHLVLPTHKGTRLVASEPTPEHQHADLLARCPLGAPGDTLWVRETWGIRDVRGFWCRDSVKGLASWEVLAEAGVEHAASLTTDDPNAYWRPSIHMPRWASRLTLRITDVRVERVQAITEEDVYREGITIPVTTEGCPKGKAKVLHSISGKHPSIQFAAPDGNGADVVRAHFASAWCDIYGAESWAANGWVWRVAFEVLR